jgi:hypothetical protein
MPIMDIKAPFYSHLEEIVLSDASKSSNEPALIKTKLTMPLVARKVLKLFVR